MIRIAIPNTCEFRKAVKLAYAWSRGLKLEKNIPPQHISAKNKREGGGGAYN